jgi:hypothetical protein
MWYSKTILAGIEDAIEALKTKGVSEEIINFINNLPNDRKGKAIGALNQNPSMSTKELFSLFDSGYKPSKQELELVRDYETKFQSWALYQYKQLRANKLTDDPRDDRWEYKQSITGYAGIKDDLDEIHDFFRGHVLDNPNYNLGTKSFQEAYDDSVEWHNAISQRGSGKFYLPFKRDESGQIVDEKIVHRFEDGSMMVRVDDPNDLDVEGSFMHHCVGSYADKVSEGFCTIYSLRNKFNNPEATIEVASDGKVMQIKGPSNTRIEDEDQVAKIKEFFENTDSVKKSSGEGHAHREASEWYRGGVEWDNSPSGITSSISEFVYGPYIDSYEDYEDQGDFGRFGIKPEEFDQEAFNEQNLLDVDVDELVDKTVEEIDSAVSSRYGKDYYYDDYNYDEIAEDIVSIAYQQLAAKVESEKGSNDEYLRQRSGFLTEDEIQYYKKRRIEQLTNNNALLSLLHKFAESYSQYEESLRNPNSNDYEQLSSDDDYKDKAIQLMGSNQNKLKIAIARRIYETYRDHPAVKDFEETFGKKFILPEISTIPETYRADMKLLDAVYENPNQLRFQDLPEGGSFNLARHKRNQQLQNDEEELVIPDDFE